MYKTGDNFDFSISSNSKSLYAIIESTNGKFFDGMFFGETKSKVYLAKQAQIFSLSFSVLNTCKLNILIYDDKDSFIASKFIEFVDENDMEIIWDFNKEYSSFYNLSNLSSVILNLDTKKYLNLETGEWLNSKFENQLELVSDNISRFIISTNEICKLDVSIKNSNQTLVDRFILNFQDSVECKKPIIVGSDTIFDDEGGTTDITFENGSKVKGATIVCYDFETRELAGKTYSDQNGKWSLRLLPSKYLFRFEFEGFESISIIRMVS